MLRILEHHEIQPYEVALVHWENEEINYTVGEYVDVCVCVFVFVPFLSCFKSQIFSSSGETQSSNAETLF